MSIEHGLRRGLPLVICAPSGAGKSTLVGRLTAEFPMEFSISCTTRKPRGNEQDGVDYIFLDRETFIDRRGLGYFAEWAEVHGNFYGTPLKPVQDRLAQGKDMLFDIDVQGAAQLSLSLPEARFVFILPPSLDELERRLRGRGTDSGEAIEGRLIRARQEYAEADFYDYLLINDDAEQAAARLCAIIDAEHCRFADQAEWLKNQ